MTALRVWLDCDPGHDDALAIMFAVLHPLIELVGISTTFGNQSCEKTTANALRVLHFLNRLDIPVYSGAHGPLKGHASFCPEIHGDSGLDLVGSSWPPLPDGASAVKSSPLDAIAAAAMHPDSHSRPLHLVVTGGQTNIAMLIAAHPVSFSRLAGVSIMGGSIVGGNTSPYAEFNIQLDPESASSVITNVVPCDGAVSSPLDDSLFSGVERVPLTCSTAPAQHVHVPLFIVPLDVTHTFLATSSIIDQVQSPILLGLLRFFEKTYKDMFGFANGPPVHDVVAMAALVAPTLFTSVLANVTVETANPITRGMLVVDKDDESLRVYRKHISFPLWKNARVATVVDVEQLWQLVLTTLAPINIA